MSELEIALEKLNGDGMMTKLLQNKSTQGIGYNKFNDNSPHTLLLKELGFKSFEEHIFPVLGQQCKHKTPTTINSSKNTTTQSNSNIYIYIYINSRL